MTNNLDTPLAKIIRPIVEGQLRSFLHDHPEVAGGWTGKLAEGKTNADAVKDSAAKRIVRDLLSESCIVRLRAALLEGSTGAQPGDVVEVATAASAADLEFLTGSAAYPSDMTLPNALSILAAVHTLDDHAAGFTVNSYPSTTNAPWLRLCDYVEAWAVVRMSVGRPIRGEQYPK